MMEILPKFLFRIKSFLAKFSTCKYKYKYIFTRSLSSLMHFLISFMCSTCSLACSLSNGFSKGVKLANTPKGQR